MRQKPSLKLSQWRKLNGVPTNKILRKKIIEYKNNKDWYKNTHEAIKQLFPHPYDRNLLLKLIAVTSQRNSLTVNVEFALSAFYAIKKGNDPLTLDYGLASPSIRGNIKRVLNNDLPHGNKIKPFTLCLLGDEKQIVIDSWMTKLFINGKRKTPNKTDIKHMQTIINKFSDEMNLTPCQVQACLWCYVKTEMNDTNNKESYDYSHYISENAIKNRSV
ncbi:MAG: hypothetical protein EHM34_00285 [Nitrosopumilales archaeon]|nr:MAG: hypothetical protein EHM34_00285 [Nitrosopumilales archaeon]